MDYDVHITMYTPKSKNIGILRMTGEVTDRFNKITLFGMALFWQKQLNSLQNLYSSFPHIQSGMII